MASSTTTSKVLCVVCKKGKGCFICGGCSQSFCPQHSNDHRNELSKQLEDIEIAHDLVKQTIIQQTGDPHQHPLLKKINQWEETAIAKIRQTAEEVRSELLTNTSKHITNVKQKLKQLSDELRQSREDNDFIESDLLQWTQKLEELREELIHPTTITIQEDSTPLITKIHIDRQDASDIFERICGNARIEENGRIVVKEGSNAHTEIRGKTEYTTGRCILRFQIEHLSGTPWIFFGIITKSEAMQVSSYRSPSSYGWSSQNQTHVNGQVTGKESIQIIQNDTVMLTIDCNKREIELKNERTNSSVKMIVDITKCSLPWQFHLNLYAANTRVRILDSTK